ncbi:hypothetical protein GQ600_21374 [Phytophthora cactorum]|nr:hypothetical protein GQ600_21374 [Phytophthora cactorum]
MQAKQYEERILKLQDALEMQKLKNTLNLYGPCRTLEEQLDKVQIALEEERDEKCNRQTNRLLMELREERVQRLQDLEEIYAKDKRLEAMTAEMSAATRGISQVNEVIAHKDAELVGLRATAKCSAKLLQVRPLVSQSVFLCANSSRTPLKLSVKEREVRMWIERYEQVMMDLHASQFRLTQLARGTLRNHTNNGEEQHSNDDYFIRRRKLKGSSANGHAIEIDNSANGVASLRPRPVALMKPVGLHDRAVRRYRRDQISNRAHASTASTTNSQPASHLKPVRSAGSLPHVNFSAISDPMSAISRDCFQCTAAAPPAKAKKNRNPDVARDERDSPYEPVLIYSRTRSSRSIFILSSFCAEKPAWIKISWLWTGTSQEGSHLSE